MAISILNYRSGSSILSNNLSCEGVMAGVFFSQSDLEMPEKVMTKHTG
jgi:hypothetical protein